MKYRAIGDLQEEGVCTSPAKLALHSLRVVGAEDWDADLQVVRVFAGIHLIALLCADRSLWVEGLHRISGQAETPSSTNDLTQIASGSEIDSVSVGEYHVLFVSGRHLYSCGRGDNGELGIGAPCLMSFLAHRVELPIGEKVKAVAAGSRFSLVLTESATVFVFGAGAFHRLGLGSATLDALLPTRLEALDGVGQLRGDGTSSGISLIAAGKWHAVAVAGESSDVYLWGWCKFSQHGHSEEALIPCPVRCSALDAVLSPDDRITKAVCGTRFTAFLTSLGQLFMM